jgi:exodeoxyribonuclease V alpha subunit
VLRAETSTDAPTFPREASTLHRLLGIAPGRVARHDGAERTLPYDLVVVDEASMVDLALMAALFRALPPSARLVLVGDKDQLASVETGTVLSDVCRALGANRFSAAFCDAFQRATARTLPAATGESHAPDAVVELQRNYRSDAAPDIATLAAAIRDGDAAGVTAKVAQLTGEAATGGVVAEFPAVREAWLAGLRARLLEHARAVRADATPEERLATLSRFRILAPRREGFCGVRHLNELFEEALDAAGARTLRDVQYAGRPVMVLENDYALRLFNGDTGVLVESADGLQAAFAGDAPGGIRLFPPQRLPRHETAHAMTVHKSQGSEFDEVLLVLPDAAHPLLTRELVYTGLTRARRRVTVLAAAGALEKAAVTPLRRDSGLADLLDGAK